MATSQNGWPVNPPRTSRLVPGTADVRVTVADGPAGDVLIHVLAQVHARVESLELDSTRGELDDWGYASRPIRGGTTTSNHASATAVDGNATRHPLGVRGTFTAGQAAEIREILAEVDHVVRWGGDYSGRVDEMHFEINADHAAVAVVAARLSQEDDMAGITDTVIDIAYRLLDTLHLRPRQTGGKGKGGELPFVTHFLALMWRVEALARGRTTVAGGPQKGEPVETNARMERLEQKLDQLLADKEGS